jgi:predicted lactoylglutathione lyase
MATPQRISFVTLGVADVARSTRFYESLGWRRAPGSQDAISFFEMQGSAFALFGHGELAHDAGLAADVPSIGPGAFRGVALALNVESRAEVDATFAEWVDKGATPTKPPEAVFWGGYSSYVADPDGHLWEIVHNPLMPNSSDGKVTFPDG